jgi:hypothetical protein
MGATKQCMLDEQSRSYARNQYYHEVQRIKRTVRLYAGQPGFVANLKEELRVLEASRDERSKAWKRPKGDNMPYKIGDRVSWTSQANGRSVPKQGAIYEIVAPGAAPTGIKGAGMPRDHESYVVKAFKETDRKRTALYWPLVHKLHKLFDVFNEQALREEIVRTWGPAGAHIDVYDMLLKKAKLSGPPETVYEDEDRKTIDLLVRAGISPMENAAKKWEAVVHEELRSAKAGGDRIAIQTAEWGVKIVTAILAGQEPGGEPKTWPGHPGEAG